MKAALALLLIAAAPAADTAIGPPPYRLIAPAVETALGEKTIAPGAVVASAILGRPDTALIAAPLTLDRLGQKRAWDRGTSFTAMSVSGVPGTPPDTYCEEEREGSIGKVLAGQMLFGLVGALRPTKLATRYCLFDKDADGALDHAFLIGAKGKGRAPFAIPATRFGLISGMELGGGSIVRLRYAGPSGQDGALRFDLELEGYGRLRRIDADDLTVKPGALPRRVTAGNAVFVVERYDPATYAAHIRLERAMAPGRILISEPRDGD